MAKKLLGKIITLTALGIVATTAISYILKYKSFHKDLEDDFFEFEDDDTDNAGNLGKDRNYIALSSDKDNFVMAAKDTFEASKGMAGAAKDILKDVGSIIADNTSAAARAAGDMTKKFTQKNNFSKDDVSDFSEDLASDIKTAAEDVKDNVTENFNEIKEEARESAQEISENIKETAEDVKEDVQHQHNDDQIFEDFH